MTASLFPSLLGSRFAALDPLLQWVHCGESRELEGRVTVQRGGSLAAKLIAILAATPPPMALARIDVKIEITEQGERWVRLFGGARMQSSLSRCGDLLEERLGVAKLNFSLHIDDGGVAWKLERISVAGVPLPVHWFEVTASITARDARYHFCVDSMMRGVGRIVRYEGQLEACRGPAAAAL